jgi:hypothetical protein
MSNHLAIATVTSALRNAVANALAADQLGMAADVTTLRPDALGSDTLKTGVNLYLYQVAFNPAFQNEDLPARRADGRLLRRPQVALDLHYLVSCFGNDADLEPQRLLGSVARTLHARPILARESITRTIQRQDAPRWIATSDLAEQIEPVRFTPLPLSLEELSKIWSVFFQTRYTLSVAYAGSVVLIESDDVAEPALPVRERHLTVAPLRQPVIEQVRTAEGEGQPILAGAKLLILGRQLGGDAATVLIGGREIPARDATATRIAFDLPADLPAGPHGLQVAMPLVPGGPARGVESNLASFVLQPRVGAASVAGIEGSGSEARAGRVVVQVAPPVGASQRAVLLLNGFGGNTGALRFTAQPRAAASETLAFPVSGVPAGEYLVRVQVDGAESALTVDDTGAYASPRVSFP